MSKSGGSFWFKVAIVIAVFAGISNAVLKVVGNWKPKKIVYIVIDSCN